MDERGNAKNPDLQEKASAILEDSQATQVDKIRALHALGFSRKQLQDEFNFPTSTVYRALPVEPENKEEGKPSKETAVMLPAKLDDRKQQIIPEYLMQHFVRLDDNRPLTPLEALILFQAARRSVMEDVSILGALVETQAKATEAQLKVLREAKGESAEIAQEAANRAAASVGAQMGAEIQALRGQIAALSPNPMAGMMTTLMQPSMQLAAQQLARMFMSTQPGTPQPDQEGQGATQQTGPPTGQQGFVPPTVEVHSRDELKE